MLGVQSEKHFFRASNTWLRSSLLPTEKDAGFWSWILNLERDSIDFISLLQAQFLFVLMT